ncbi:D-Ala-D-Ala carboxypeptidase family metallohydrolase, partial [Parabacteroides sp.]
MYHRQPLHVTSGYQCEELNRLVGGVPGSQHVKGEAVDIYVLDRYRLLEDLVGSRLNFD